MEQLPSESRFVQTVSEQKDWNWDKEVQSRILAKLDQISCNIVNSHLKKGKKPVDPEEQFQPEYVKAAKNAYQKKKEEKAKLTPEEEEKNRLFWQNRYNNIKML